MNISLDTLKKKLLVKYPFFGSVLIKVDYKESYDIDTACTDGEVLYFNPNFMNSLPLDEQIFIFAHELCHVAFNHILRSEGKNLKWWNIATDAVINAMLSKDGLPQVKGTVDIEDAINYNAEQLYEKLVKEEEEEKQKQQNGSNDSKKQNGNDNDNSKSNGPNNSEDDNDKKQPSSSRSWNDDKEEHPGHDDHSGWAEALEKLKERQKRNSSEDDLGKDVSDSEYDEQDAFDKNEKIREAIRRELEKELEEEISRQEGTYQYGSDSYGRGEYGRNRNTNSDVERRSVTDWRYHLRESINYDYDWSSTDAEVEDGVVSSKLNEQPFSETEIIIDTSGSISESLIKNFLKECKYIIQNSKVKVGFFDEVFYGFQDLRNEYEIDNLNIQGGGGTNFEVAINAFTNRVTNKIIFTDGMSTMPNKYCDAIWVVVGNFRINPPGGKVIYISREDLRRLESGRSR